MIRTGFALLAALCSSFAAWALVQLAERLLFGHWSWTAEAFLVAAPLVIGVTGLVLGLPIVLILAKLKRRPRWWVYTALGSILALVPPFLYLVGLATYPDKAGNAEDAVQASIDAATFLATTLAWGPYAVVVGAVGGLVFWFVARDTAAEALAIDHFSP